MEEEKKEVYSVWALPDEETEPRFRKLMEALRSEFNGPRFDPHVTVAVAANLTADEAKQMFEAACDGLKGYTATVDRVATGTFFYQCVFLLLRSTPEVMEAGEHCKNHFHCSTTTPYMPHLSLLYAELTEEEKKKAQEKAYTLDDTLDGLSFRLNRLVLCRTDTEDKTLESWEKVAAAGHFMAHFKPFTGKFYVPHMSILYGDLTEEEKKKALEKAYTLDSSLDGLDFRINRVALWITDADVGSWVKIDEHNLIS